MFFIKFCQSRFLQFSFLDLAHGPSAKIAFQKNNQIKTPILSCDWARLVLVYYNIEHVTVAFKITLKTVQWGSE